jgi:hypothetical protein
MCAWPSISPGVTGLPPRSMRRVAGAVWAAIAASGPTARIRSPAIATACVTVEAESTVITLAFFRIRSAGLAAGDAGCACVERSAAPAAAIVPKPAAFRKSRRGIVSSAIVASRSFCASIAIRRGCGEAACAQYCGRRRLLFCGGFFSNANR